MKFVLAGILLIALSSAAVGAQSFTRQLGDRTLNLEEVFYEDFEKNLDNWVSEGDARVSLSEGWLEVDASSGDIGAATLWCAREFSGAQLVEYDVRLMGNTIQSNINMFLLASLTEGGGIIETAKYRTGAYGEYHLFPNYLITLLNGSGPDKRTRLRYRARLNPGFKLVEEGWFEPLVFGRVYHVSYLLEPPVVSVFLDGQMLGRAAFDIRLERGFHGLRIWHTHSIYDNFRVSRITP